jgi:hypothetical protein
VPVWMQNKNGRRYTVLGITIDGCWCQSLFLLLSLWFFSLLRLFNPCAFAHMPGRPSAIFEYLCTVCRHGERQSATLIRITLEKKIASSFQGSLYSNCNDHKPAENRKRSEVSRGGACSRTIRGDPKYRDLTLCSASVYRWGG